MNSPKSVKRIVIAWEANSTLACVKQRPKGSNDTEGSVLTAVSDTRRRGCGAHPVPMQGVVVRATAVSYLQRPGKVRSHLCIQPKTGMVCTNKYCIPNSELKYAFLLIPPNPFILVLPLEQYKMHLLCLPHQRPLNIQRQLSVPLYSSFLQNKPGQLLGLFLISRSPSFAGT